MLSNPQITPNARWIFCGQDVADFFANIPSSRTTLKNLQRNYFKLAILFLYGFIQLFYLFIIQKKGGSNFKQCDHYLIKTGVDHMHQNYYTFFNLDEALPCIELEVFNKKSITSIKKISAYKLMQSFFQNYSIFKENTNFTGSKLNQLLFDKGMKSIAIYSYWCALFKEMSSENKNATLFSCGPYIPGCAASCNGIKTIYLAHGLIDRFYANPAYSEARVFSKEEQTEYMSYLGHTKVDLYPIAYKKNFNKQVIIFLGAIDLEMDFQDLSELINFFNKKGFLIIVKTHPSNAYSNILDNLSKIHNIDKIVREKLNGIEAINKYQPQFTVGWSSTGLCESLRAGVIPICLSTKSDPYINNALYPIIQRSIFWYDERDLIDFASMNVGNYHSTLKLLETR